MLLSCCRQLLRVVGCLRRTRVPSACSLHYVLYSALIAADLFIVRTAGVEIDNGVARRPTVDCGADLVTLAFTTRRPFLGKIFVKGYAYQNECVQTGNGQTSSRFEIRFNQCGVHRARQINGMAMSTTIIVSFHPLFLTKVDKAYRVNCFYMEAQKNVEQQLDVSMLTTEDLSNQMSMPTCKYEILSASDKRTPVRYARIGDPVYHKWTCAADAQPDMHCMRVHSCSVTDGQGGQSVRILDADGCSVDRFLLQNLEYTTDLMAGQESHVFKFADRPALYFNCRIEIKIRDNVYGCTSVRPQCTGSSGTGSTRPANGNGNGGVGVYPSQASGNGNGGVGVGVYPSQASGVQQPGTRPNGVNGVNTGGGVAGGGSYNPPTAGSYTPKIRRYFDALAARALLHRGRKTRAVPLNNATFSTAGTGGRQRLLASALGAGDDSAVNFDLPQAKITVFELDAVYDDPETQVDETDEAKKLIDLLENRNRPELSLAGLSPDGIVCMASEKFAGYALALAGVSVTSLSILAVVYLRRKHIFGLNTTRQKA